MISVRVLFVFSTFILISSQNIPGGISEIDKNDPAIKQVSEFAWRGLEEALRWPNRGKITEIVNARVQVVSGMNYYITFRVFQTNCAIGSTANLDDCPVNNNEASVTCDAVIWVRSWLNENSIQVTNSSCSSETSVPAISKNGIIGGGDHDVGHMGTFLQFVDEYKKNYKDKAEFKRRFKIFRMNMKKVKKLQESEQGTAVYGATKFADLTKYEFQKYHLGLKPSLARPSSAGVARIPDIDIPDSFDWRTKKAVTPVKNQGMCGSCWAFSVTGNIEGQWFLNSSKLVQLSEQELVDCDHADAGCNGGFMTNAYTQIIKMGGLETESDYPYEGEDEKCNFNREKVRVKIGGYVNVSQDETDMAKYLVKNGPLSIGINANAMQFYIGGVSHPWKFLCSPKSIDHGVLIVGYGTTQSFLNKTLPYWIVKNSWGTGWGEKGYYRVYRGDGTCGINLMVSSATI